MFYALLEHAEDRQVAIPAGPFDGNVRQLRPDPLLVLIMRTASLDQALALSECPAVQLVRIPLYAYLRMHWKPTQHYGAAWLV